jgi:hypothetical protein
VTADLKQRIEETNDKTARGKRLHGRTGNQGSYREDKGITGVKFEPKLGNMRRTGVNRDEQRVSPGLRGRANC